MSRKWLLAGLGALALAASAVWYHLFVLQRSERHFRALLESSTVEEKRLHYAEIHRYYHPWNPYLERAERWREEDGHEWEFLREQGSTR